MQGSKSEEAVGTIITVATQKGGAGKTMLTRVLSVNLVTQGWKVAVIDADPNKGFSEWAQIYTGPSLVVHTEPDEKRLANLPADLAEEYEAVIIDTAGFGSRSMLVAIGAADGVIIPCMPDRGSVREAEQTAEWVRNLSKSTRRSIDFRVVMTGFDLRRSADKYALEQATAGLGLPMLNARLSDRTAYAATSWSGTVPVDGVIGQEAQLLADEIIGLGWLARETSASAA
jgi:chromosome partitioning protein